MLYIVLTTRNIETNQFLTPQKKIGMGVAEEGAEKGEHVALN